MRKARLSRIAAVALALCALLGAAFAAGVTVTLRQEDPVARQYGALAEYLAQLPTGQRQEWEILLYPDGAPAQGILTAEMGLPDTVYITKTGKKYHSTKDCSGLSNAKEVLAVSRDEALRRGLTPCKVCKPR